MPLDRRLFLLPLALGALALHAEDAPATPRKARACRPASDFGLSVQLAQPLHDLGTALDHRTGYGLGLQWTRDHGDYHASRTRFEWNTFPEGPQAGSPLARAYAKNLVLSWDHLFRLTPGESGMYLVGGLGGVRWSLNQTAPGARTDLTTTKLGVTAGLGVQLQHHVTLEARYLLSGIQRTFDANTLQVSAAWRF